MVDVNTENDKDIAKEIIPNQEVTTDTPPVPEPIPVTIVSTESINKTEIKEVVTQHLEELKTKSGKLTKAMEWVHSRALTCVTFISIGIVIGMLIMAWIQHNEMVRSINLQCFEFTHRGVTSQFKVFPSNVAPYYKDSERSVPIIPKLKEESSKPEPISEPEPVITKKGK